MVGRTQGVDRAVDFMLARGGAAGPEGIAILPVFLAPLTLPWVDQQRSRGARRSRLRFLACQGSGTEERGNDVRNVRLWRALLGVDKRTVIEDIELDDSGEEGADGEDVVVAHVRPRRGAWGRCGR